MVSKKKTSKKLTKSEFIRSKPASAPAKEVVAEAAKLGLTFSENYVYTIRRAAALRAERKARPAKVGRPRGPQGLVTKSAFIRQQPSELTARQVVEAAREQGLEVTEHYVYKIRGTTTAKKGKAPARPAAAPAPQWTAPSVSKPAAPRAPVAAAAGGDSETEFRRLVVTLGAGRARALLADVETALSAIISGR